MKCLAYIFEKCVQHYPICVNIEFINITINTGSNYRPKQFQLVWVVFMCREQKALHSDKHVAVFFRPVRD